MKRIIIIISLLLLISMPSFALDKSNAWHFGVAFSLYTLGYYGFNYGLKMSKADSEMWSAIVVTGLAVTKEIIDMTIMAQPPRNSVTDFIFSESGIAIGICFTYAF